MVKASRSIFRSSAMQHYMRGRERDVLPHLVSPLVFVFFWLYHCGLGPGEIVRFCPQEWSDVQEIYQLRRTLLERALRNADQGAFTAQPLEPLSMGRTRPAHE